jgi:hypothetical protein
MGVLCFKEVFEIEVTDTPKFIEGIFNKKDYHRGIQDFLPSFQKAYYSAHGLG